MKRIKAFFAALLLFVLTVGAIHGHLAQEPSYNSRALGAVTTERKAQINYALRESLGENSIPVFGSSEFQHGIDTIYHPSHVFAQSDFSPVLIGAGYYQSLGHAVTLAAISDSMQNAKAVLILSPQWFRKTGVLAQAYASRFSESHYAKAMANEKLSDEVKSYLSERTQELLSLDEKTRELAMLYDKVLWKQQGTKGEQRRVKIRMAFLEEKEKFETMALSFSSEYRKCVKEQAENESKEANAGEADAIEAEEAEADAGEADAIEAEANAGEAETGEKEAEEVNIEAEPDWEALLAQAEADGQIENQNPFYINDEVYKKLEAFLDRKQNINSGAVKGYQTGPEFEDLECFLKVCQELEIQPLLVLLPVNGYYYDFTGFPVEARQAYYEKIRTLAESYQAEVADLSGEEYTEYFFEDRVHVGKKGWVAVNESIYQFYKKN